MQFTKDMDGGMIPTKTEMDVLMILWKHGPSTVRFVHDKLNEQKDAVIYTSTLKLMQVMKEKGMLDRDETNMKHVYSAVLEEGRVKGGMLDRFIDNMYNGSPSDLIVSLLGNEKTSAGELQKIKDLLNNMDK
jgi:BlaI family transcriptional regulator, penicillinase repressor